MLEYTITIGGNYGSSSHYDGQAISPALMKPVIENFALQVTRLAGGCTITKATGYWADAGKLVVEESTVVAVVGSADILPKLQSLVKVCAGRLWQDSILLVSRKLETVEFMEGK